MHWDFRTVPCIFCTIPKSSVGSKTLAVTKTHHQNKLINCLAMEKFLNNVDQISSGLSFMSYLYQIQNLKM